MISNKKILYKRQNDTELTTIGHRTAFNNKQSLYYIDSYERPRNDKCKKKIKLQNYRSNLCNKKINEIIIHKQQPLIYNRLNWDKHKH